MSYTLNYLHNSSMLPSLIWRAFGAARPMGRPPRRCGPTKPRQEPPARIATVRGDGPAVGADLRAASRGNTAASEMWPYQTMAGTAGLNRDRPVGTEPW